MHLTCNPTCHYTKDVFALLLQEQCFASKIMCPDFLPLLLYSSYDHSVPKGLLCLTSQHYCEASKELLLSLLHK